MHAPLMCVVFAICIYLQAAISQYTGCDGQVNQEITEAVEDESPAFGNSNKQFSPWSYIGKQDVERIANSVVDWMHNAWNSGVKFKLRIILKNEQNDTLMKVQLRDIDKMTDNNAGRTFGIRRRMQLFFMLPISFKLGIIMTLLLVLTALSLKTLIIGFVILLLLLHHTQGHAKLWGPYKTHQVSDSHKNIHIHIHTSPQDHHQYEQSWHEPSQHIIYSA